MSSLPLAETPREPAQESVWSRLALALRPDEEKPRLSPTIEAQNYQTRSGTPYVVIHNPATGTYLRLDPREYELLSLMDGSRTVKSLTIAYFQRHRVLALPRIAGLVALLRQHAFLVDLPVHVSTALAHRLAARSFSGRIRRVAHQLRAARWTWAGADSWFSACYGAFGKYLFHPVIGILGVVLGVASPILFAYGLRQNRYEVLRTGGSYATALLILACFQVVAVLMHEMGHGLAVKHAGRRVLGAGAMLYAGAPTAFVDTTDIWMAAPKYRLLASFAGPWTGMVLGGVALLAALALPASPLGSVAFAWGAVFLVLNLLNFNPLIELDGYYLLVDLIDKPLFRARALHFVRSGLWQRVLRREPLRGDETALLLYAALAGAWTVLEVALLVAFWQAQVWPILVAHAALQPTPSRVVLALLLAVALAGPVVLSLASVLFHLAGRLSGLVRRLHRRARERPYHEAVEALRAVAAWSELPEMHLLEIARALRKVQVDQGTEVVRQGDPGDTFYVINRGAFEVLVDGEPVACLGRGDYFGERALLQAGVRTATVLGLEPGELWALSRPAFDRLLGPDLAVRHKLEAAMERRAALATMPLFTDLSPVEMDLLLTRFEAKDVATGTIVVRQEEAGDAFYVVATGELDVMRDGQHLATLHTGDAFGEIALLESVPRTATVTAAQPSQLLILDREGFRDVLASYCQRESDLRQLSHFRQASHSAVDAPVGAAAGSRPNL